MSGCEGDFETDSGGYRSNNEVILGVRVKFQ